MKTRTEKKSENKSRAVAHNLPNKQSNHGSSSQFVDNRPEAIVQKKVNEMVNNSSKVQQRKTITGETSNNQNINPTAKSHLGAATSVIQLAKKNSKKTSGAKAGKKKGKPWTKGKAEKYKAHLRRRSAKRLEKGKKKNSAKLLEKYIKARQSADPSWSPKLAGTPFSRSPCSPFSSFKPPGGRFCFW
jgi:hypothetical protein